MAKEDRETVIYTAFEEFETFDPATPEKNLLRAILLSAMADLNKGGEDKIKAREYFLNPDEEYLFSFRSVCNQLSVDPNTILILAGFQKPEFARKLGKGVPRPSSAGTKSQAERS